MDSDLYAKETEPENARKRIKTTPLREKQKIQRYSMKHAPQLPDCKHKDVRFKCAKVTTDDVKKFANGFYESTSKIIQDCYLLKYCNGFAPERTNRRNGGPPRGVCIHYNMRKANGKLIKVCKKAFLGALRVSEFRVKRICKVHLKTGNMPKENRGGDRKSIVFHSKKAAVIAFIKKFKVLEIHYCRSKIKNRQYLPSELNISKISKMYNDQAENDLKVKAKYFRKIFITKFNIGFKTPGTDKCSTCLKYTEQIKFSNDAKIKNKFILKKRGHKLRAEAFYKLLREKSPEMDTFAFDCQKNQVLPKVPDQSAYFSRQLYQHNFGVVQGTSKSPLTKSNVFLYRWTENVRPKGSNEIASLMFHRLNHTNWIKKSKIRMMADGCGGQNKNSIMLGMCAYWLLLKSPKNIKQLEIIFPVVGHSFLPPDRVFALIERDVKEKETIIDPSEYTNIFENHGTTIELGSAECPVYDWKSETLKICKTPAQMHFKFNDSKRFILKKSKNNIEVRGERSYQADTGVFGTINKKGKTIFEMSPKILQTGGNDKELKMVDVYKLLAKHFGDNWMEMPNLKFYKDWMETMDSEKLLKLKSKVNTDELEDGEDDDDKDCNDPICECHNYESDE